MFLDFSLGMEKFSCIDYKLGELVKVGVANLQLLIASRTTLENCLVPFLSLPPPILVTQCSKLVYFNSKEKFLAL